MDDVDPVAPASLALDDPLLDGLPEDVPLVSDVDLFCEAARAPIVAVTSDMRFNLTSLTGDTFHFTWQMFGARYRF